MRDIAITLIMLGLLVPILKYPWIGVLVATWLTMFSPHTYAFGFASQFPFVMIITLATILSVLMHGKELQFPKDSIAIHFVLLPLWMSFTWLFALEPNDAYPQGVRVLKVFFAVILAASLLRSRKQLEAFLWVIVLSIGYYGMKGGLFTILTGGGNKVYGPPGVSFLSDNNAIPVALIMVIPLMYYLSTTVSSKWIKRGLYGAMFLSSVAVLGSHSRGAMLAIAAMILFLWLKSSKKFLLGLVLVILVPVAVGFMPAKWTQRMESIKSYEEDGSAQGRLNAWMMAINIAKNRPLVGGGYELYSARTFARYAPNPTDTHTAHSIYFQMLGEHGYIGLALFLSLGITAWLKARRLIKLSQDRPEFAWAGALARAIQVSLVGFAVGGAFVNISYWELPYDELVVLMAAYRLVSAVERKPEPGGVGRKPNLAAT